MISLGKYLPNSRTLGSCLAVFFLIGLDSKVTRAEQLQAIMITTDRQVAEPLMTAVRDHLSDMPVTFELVEVGFSESDENEFEEHARRIADEKDAQIVFWRNSEFPDKVFVFVRRFDGEHFMVRTIDRKMETRDSQYEATAIIIRYTIQSVIDGRELQDSESDEDDGEAIEEETSNVESQGVHLEASLAYGLGMFSKDSLASHGGRIDLGVFWEHFGMYVAYRFVMPIDSRTEFFDFKLQTHPLELGLAFRLIRGSFLLQIGAAVLMDWITWEVAPSSDEVEPRSDTMNFRLGFSPNLVFGWRPFTHVGFFIGASADIFVFQNEFRVIVGDQEQEVVSPLIVSPYFTAGVSFQFF